MCFIKKESVTLTVTKKPIKVYKVLVRNKLLGGLRSEFFNLMYERGKLNNTLVTSTSTKVTTGFHSFTSLKGATRYIKVDTQLGYRGGTIVEFEIPAGSEYYKGETQVVVCGVEYKFTSYVSNQIIYKRIVKRGGK